MSDEENVKGPEIEALLRTKDSGAELDKKWGGSGVLDWALVALPDWRDGPPPPMLSLRIFRNTPYPQMKSKWESWPTPCNIRPATPDEISADDVHQQELRRKADEREQEAARRLEASEVEQERLRQQWDRRKAEEREQEAARIAEARKAKQRGLKADQRANFAARFVVWSLSAVAFYFLIGDAVIDISPTTTYGYAWKYKVASSRVLIEMRPHDCEWGSAPLGDKHCHYKAEVSSVRTGTSNDGTTSLVSYDEGKTWSINADHVPPSVSVWWTKVNE